MNGPDKKCPVCGEIDYEPDPKGWSETMVSLGYARRQLQEAMELARIKDFKHMAIGLRVCVQNILHALCEPMGEGGYKK